MSTNQNETPGAVADIRQAKALDRDAILSAHDVSVEAVDVPEWGGSVYVKTFSGRDRDAFELSFGDGAQDARARLAVATVCNAQGELLFTPADVGALTQKSGAALDRVFEVAMRINRLSNDEVDALKKT